MAPPVVIFDSSGIADLGVEYLKSLHDIMVPVQVAPPSTFAEIQTADVAFMLFTSGTTGFNKAVELTRQMIFTNLAQGRVYASALTSEDQSDNLPMKLLSDGDTMGWLMSGFEAMIIDPETHEPMEIVQDGVMGPGEFVLRGPGLFRGYFNRPDATKDAFIEIGGKSWYRMGDVVSMDKDGCLSVVDRTKEMFKAAGNTVIPTEI
ncbi:hypothetical protein AMAG_18795 [Allomyces macrogynus ATCC 38327]|uniref:Uncharacterized protein n=1 Tax=Allomyces macrogynus (strain ATCC 38327) TaxID=578462 RepID=A0A0L0SHM3_ALLM3|nr:hypothetical protein AMAG_18795 [Allomyces macrogynus ATCC 38327]|eukprot:KNE61991.1 hypothetical protein AMAG_18795 [Allomyces macrogynus ATCC 38327]